jgi:hypothetical protein
VIYRRVWLIPAFIRAHKVIKLIDNLGFQNIMPQNNSLLRLCRKPGNMNSLTPSTEQFGLEIPYPNRILTALPDELFGLFIISQSAWQMLA